MLGIEKAYANAVIRALLYANFNLMQATVKEALRKSSRYGKKGKNADTLGLDAIPETSIATQIQQYDQHAVLITEEQGEISAAYSQATDPRSFRTFFISDPTDRSAQFAKFLEETNKNKRVGEVMREPKARKRWEKNFSAPASITGPFGAITCIRRGLPILAAMINYLTQELFIACSAGVFKVKIQKGRNLEIDNIRSTEENKLRFGSFLLEYPQMKKFVTFLGKEGYWENFRDSQLMDEEEFKKGLAYPEPGGPSRILYFSNIQPKKQSLGFILANGEKIGEWIHWLPFVRFARTPEDITEPCLKIFEIWHSRPHTKEGILMSTSPNYSIFRQTPNGKIVIDVAIFGRFKNPSKIRSSLLICPNSNTWAQQVVQRYDYREIQFASDG